MQRCGGNNRVWLCENVWPTFQPSSTKSRYLNMMSSLTGKTGLSNIGLILCLSHFVQFVAPTSSLAQKLYAKAKFR